MRFVMRSDLGGRAANLEALKGVATLDIKRPVVLLAGGNGSGKSSLLAALRQATGLVGPEIGKFVDNRWSGKPLAFPHTWSVRHKAEIDLARHALLLDPPNRTWSSSRDDADDGGMLPEKAVGVLDPVALGWSGQRVWLHDGRMVDAHDSIRGDFDMTSMRRSADDRVRSHGQQMTGRLRYAVAWALGMLDVKDPYDSPPEQAKGYEDVPNAVAREIYARLAGHPTGDPARTTERWLLLDEPETGLDPVVLARLMATLADKAGDGRLRVICATHSPLVLGLAAHESVQVVDMDGYANRIEKARIGLATQRGRAELAAEEIASLERDVGVAVSTDRGLTGQGRFTAHEARSVPYPEAIVAPYGKPECLENMRCNEKPENTPGRRR